MSSVCLTEVVWRSALTICLGETRKRRPHSNNCSIKSHAECSTENYIKISLRGPAEMVVICSQQESLTSYISSLFFPVCEPSSLSFLFVLPVCLRFLDLCLFQPMVTSQSLCLNKQEGFSVWAQFMMCGLTGSSSGLRGHFGGHFSTEEGF